MAKQTKKTSPVLLIAVIVLAGIVIGFGAVFFCGMRIYSKVVQRYNDSVATFIETMNLIEKRKCSPDNLRLCAAELQELSDFQGPVEEYILICKVLLKDKESRSKFRDMKFKLFNSFCGTECTRCFGEGTFNCKICNGDGNCPYCGGKGFYYGKTVNGFSGGESSDAPVPEPVAAPAPAAPTAQKKKKGIVDLISTIGDNLDNQQQLPAAAPSAPTISSDGSSIDQEVTRNSKWVKVVCPKKCNYCKGKGKYHCHRCDGVGSVLNLPKTAKLLNQLHETLAGKAQSANLKLPKIARYFSGKK